MQNKQDSELTMIHDSKLYSAPNKFSSKEKRSFKETLCKNANIKRGTKNILIGFEWDSTDTHNHYLFEEILEGLSHLPVNVVILGKKKNHLEDYSNVKYLSNTKTDADMIQKGADLMVLPQSLNTEDKCLTNGTPCIFHNSKMYCGHLIDFNPIHETGNSFACNKANSWILFATIVKVIEAYKFSYDWNTICKNAFATGQGV